MSTMAMRSEPDAVTSSASSSRPSSLPRDLGLRLSEEMLRKLHADLVLLLAILSNNTSQPPIRSPFV